jgi:hypothetical protein
MKHRPELAIAAIAAIVSIPATYALQRLADVLFRSEPNPATVTPSVTIAMFTRLTIAGYLAPVIGFAFYSAARRDRSSAIEGVYFAAMLSATLAAAQGIFTP